MKTGGERKGKKKKKPRFPSACFAREHLLSLSLSLDLSPFCLWRRELHGSPLTASGDGRRSCILGAGPDYTSFVLDGLRGHILQRCHDNDGSLGSNSLGWKGTDPCNSWPGVSCDGNRITSIQLASRSISCIIPSTAISSLTKLTTLSLQGNNFTDALPSIASLSSLQSLYLDHDKFSSIPADILTWTVLTYNSRVLSRENNSDEHHG